MEENLKDIEERIKKAILESKSVLDETVLNARREHLLHIEYKLNTLFLFIFFTSPILLLWNVSGEIFYKILITTILLMVTNKLITTIRIINTIKK